MDSHTTVRRGVAVLALAALLPVLTGCWGAPAPAQTPTPTPTSAPPADPGAASSSSHTIPCATPGQSSPYDPIPSSSGSSTSSGSADWVGVYQHVNAHLDSAGSLKGTPKETTLITASGDQTGTVTVPLTTSKVTVKDEKRSDKAKAPTVKNDTATVELRPEGIADLKLDSSFEQTLPVDVAVSYTFNGEKIPNAEVAKKIKGKRGTVEVSYTMTNRSTIPVGACFTGFDGQPQQRTVDTPIPIIAELDTTLPQKATSYIAPGAAPATAKKGISLSWTEPLFEPFGPTASTVTMTYTMDKMAVPTMYILLSTLDPRTISGQAAATSSKELGAAQAAAGAAIASVQSAVSAIGQRSGGFQQSRKTSSRGGGTGAVTLPSFTGAGVSLPGLSLPALPGPSFDVGAPALPAGPQFDAPSITVPKLTDPHLPTTDFAGLETRLTDLLGTLDATVVDSRLGTLLSAVNGVGGDLTAMNGTADAILAAAGDLATASAQASAGLAALNAQLPPIVAAAISARQLLDQLQADVDALHHPVDAALQKLQTDLTTAKQRADALVTAVTGLEHLVQSVSGAVAALQSSTATLTQRANDLKATVTDALMVKQAALVSAQGDVAATITKQLADATTAGAALRTKLETEAAQSAANAKKLTSLMNATVFTAAHQAVQQAEDTATAAVAAARASATDALDAAKTSVNEATAKAQAAVSQAVSAAAAQAGQAIQSAQATAQAQAATAAAKVSAAVEKADTDYAQLLVLNQQALYNQLPAGSATGATSQKGRFVYKIDGT